MVCDNLKPFMQPAPGLSGGTRTQFPPHKLTDRFPARASHNLLEPCFTQTPRGDSLAALSDWLKAEVERYAPQQLAEAFGKEQRWLRPMPQRAFDPRRPTSVSVGRSAMAKVERAWCLVPSHWAGLRWTS